jgi:hypothetical protein
MFQRDKDRKLLEDILQLQLDIAGVQKPFNEVYVGDNSWVEKYTMTTDQKRHFLQKGANKIYHSKSISKKNAKKEINEINRIFGLSIR